MALKAALKVAPTLFLPAPYTLLYSPKTKIIGLFSKFRKLYNTIAANNYLLFTVSLSVLIALLMAFNKPILPLINNRDNADDKY